MTKVILKDILKELVRIVGANHMPHFWIGDRLKEIDQAFSEEEEKPWEPTSDCCKKCTICHQPRSDCMFNFPYQEWLIEELKRVNKAINSGF